MLLITLALPESSRRILSADHRRLRFFGGPGLQHDILVFTLRALPHRDPEAAPGADNMMRTWNRRQIAKGVAAATLMPTRRVFAQTSQRTARRIGLMMAVSETDPEGQARVEAFRQGLLSTGLKIGDDVIIDIVWYMGSFQLAQSETKALLDRGAQVIVVNGTPGMDAIRASGTSIPIIFVVVSNPVGVGYVPNLSRPGGNVTGFSTFEPEMSGKWLQILRQLLPGMKNVSMLLDPKFAGFNSLWQAVEEIAPTHGIVPHAARASSLGEIEAALAAITVQKMPGLIVSPSPINTVNRHKLIAMANEAGIPAIYPFRFYVRDGALIAYGFNAADQFTRAAGYVSRVLRGEKAGDLPVQSPRLFEFGINLKTAKQIGVAVPEAMLLAADEIVE
jgi:putative ABC transport system substrate-binding protein